MNVQEARESCLLEYILPTTKTAEVAVYREKEEMDSRLHVPSEVATSGNAGHVEAGMEETERS